MILQYDLHLKEIKVIGFEDKPVCPCYYKELGKRYLLSALMSDSKVCITAVIGPQIIQVRGQFCDFMPDGTLSQIVLSYL